MIISHKQAKKEGLKHFFTGEPCKHWHVSPRFVTSQRCLDCHGIWMDATRSTKILTAFTLYWWCCQNCWEPDWTVLSFHHRKWHDGQREKLSAACRNIIKAWRIQKHLYQLLCANCHIRADLRDGTNVRGKKLREIQQKNWYFPKKKYTKIELFMLKLINSFKFK